MGQGAGHDDGTWCRASLQAKAGQDTRSAPIQSPTFISRFQLCSINCYHHHHHHHLEALETGQRQRTQPKDRAGVPGVGYRALGNDLKTR